jgi:hypothetical protein
MSIDMQRIWLAATPLAAIALSLVAGVYGEEGVLPRGGLGWFRLPSPLEARKEQIPDDPRNLVVNGSFERRTSGEPPVHIDTFKAGSTDLVGWEIIDPLGAPASPDATDRAEGKEDRQPGWTVDWIGPTRWKAAHGQYCLDLDAGVRQAINTVAGQTYELSFAIAVNPELGPQRTRLRLLIDDEVHEFTLDSSGKTASDLGWVTQRIKFTPQRKGTTLTFLNAAPTTQSAGVALDHVVVKDASHAVTPDAPRPQRYQVTETSQGPILLNTTTGQTWRLITRDGQSIWLPILR